MRLTIERPELISLAAGFTDRDTLPATESRRLLTHILRNRRTAGAALQYGTTVGDQRLRDLTGRHVADLDAVACRAAPLPKPSPETYAPERIIITNGSQQLLYLTVEALCDPGDIVLVEDPTYFVFLGIGQSHGLRHYGVRLAEDGLDIEELQNVLAHLSASGDLARVKLFYSVSYYQNPTGITSTWNKKAKALEVLRSFERRAGHPIYWLEDAAYRELRFSGADTPSALTVPAAVDRVLYAGTYSKPFATGVRLGFAFLPEPLRAVITRIKGNHDFGTSSLCQALLAQALGSGTYRRHLSVLRRRYAHKAKVMAASIERHFPKAAMWRPAQGGLYLWVRLPCGLRTGPESEIFRAALDHEVLYVPGELCYADDPLRKKPNLEMRLSFGGASEANIRKGIARLGDVLRAQMA